MALPSPFSPAPHSETLFSSGSIGNPAMQGAWPPISAAWRRQWAWGGGPLTPGGVSNAALKRAQARGVLSRRAALSL